MQVGCHGPLVSDFADDLGCDWHTVMDTVTVYGTPLIDDPLRFVAVGGSRTRPSVTAAARRIRSTGLAAC